MATTIVPITVVRCEINQPQIGNQFVVLGCKATQPDDPSYIKDFATLDEALVAYAGCTYPIKSLEYWPR